MIPYEIREDQGEKEAGPQSSWHPSLTSTTCSRSQTAARSFQVFKALLIILRPLGEHFSLSNHSPPYTITEEKNEFRPPQRKDSSLEEQASPYHCLMSIPLLLSSFLEKNYLHLMVRACKLVCTITMSTISITTCTMSTMSTTCTTSWLRACQLATLQGGMPTTSCHPATTAPGLQNTPLPPTAKLCWDPKDSLL